MKKSDCSSANSISIQNSFLSELKMGKSCAKMPFRVLSTYGMLVFKIVFSNVISLIFDHKSLPTRISSEHVEANPNENDLPAPVNNSIPESETEMKVLTVQQYNRLVQLIPKVEELEETIRDMKVLIERKENEIDNLKKTFSNLRGVSIFAIFRIFHVTQF